MLVGSGAHQELSDTYIR